MNDILRRSPQHAEVWIMRFDVQLEDCGETDTDKSFGLLVPPALADFALTLKIVGRGSGELSGAAHLARPRQEWKGLAEKTLWKGHRCLTSRATKRGAEASQPEGQNREVEAEAGARASLEAPRAVPEDPLLPFELRP